MCTPYPGPRDAIPSPWYCSDAGVEIAKPLLRAKNSVGDGIVDAGRAIHHTRVEIAFGRSAVPKVGDCTVTTTSSGIALQRVCDACRMGYLRGQWGGNSVEVVSWRTVVDRHLLASAVVKMIPTDLVHDRVKRVSAVEQDTELAVLA